VPQQNPSPGTTKKEPPPKRGRKGRGGQESQKRRAKGGWGATCAKKLLPTAGGPPQNAQKKLTQGNGCGPTVAGKKAPKHPGREENTVADYRGKTWGHVLETTMTNKTTQHTNQGHRREKEGYGNGNKKDPARSTKKKSCRTTTKEKGEVRGTYQKQPEKRNRVKGKLGKLQLTQKQRRPGPGGQHFGGGNRKTKQTKNNMD